jgi:hypothetical protein
MMITRSRLSRPLVALRPTVNVVEQNDFGPRQNAANLGDAFMPVHGPKLEGARIPRRSYADFKAAYLAD